MLEDLLELVLGEVREGVTANPKPLKEVLFNEAKCGEEFLGD